MLELTDEVASAVVQNAHKFLTLDASDEEQYQESLDRLLALQMMFEDLLRQAGVNEDPLTDLAERARTNNPYYVAILPKDGLSPKRSGKNC